MSTREILRVSDKDSVLHHVAELFPLLDPTTVSSLERRVVDDRPGGLPRRYVSGSHQRRGAISSCIF
jgi:hypothetical protein